MSRIVVQAFVTLDGVVQAGGGPDEDREGGFEHGGWQEGYDLGGIVLEWESKTEALLLGRKTYEIFAGSWGSIPEMSASPIGAALNSRPKFVVSTSLTAPKWAGTTVLTGDVASAVEELKAQPDGELLVPGSGVLVRTLLADNLVDQLDLVIYPVVVGQGTRLFPDAGPDIALDLVESRSTPSGVTIQTYRPTGRPQYATASPPK